MVDPNYTSRFISNNCISLQFEKGIHRPKKPKNILQKLYSREISERNSKIKLFDKKLPARLAFKLEDLVDDVEQLAGHVFLGFSRDGHFLISYNVDVEEIDNLVVPYHGYTLHWWRFIPYQPLKKVSQIPLFGDQSIAQELFIAVCQWPSDDTKVLVHGWSVSESRDQQLRQCYITITAIPNLEKCEACDDLSTPVGEDGELSDSSTNTSFRCLQHGFAVHTKYHLVPPFPKLSPVESMSLDGTVVINTGDSLVALTVNLDKSTGSDSGMFKQDKSNIEIDFQNESSVTNDDKYSSISDSRSSSISGFCDSSDDSISSQPEQITQKPSFDDVLKLRSYAHFQPEANQCVAEQSKLAPSTRKTYEYEKDSTEKCDCKFLCFRDVSQYTSSPEKEKNKTDLRNSHTLRKTNNCSCNTNSSLPKLEEKIDQKPDEQDSSKEQHLTSPIFSNFVPQRHSGFHSQDTLSFLADSSNSSTCSSTENLQGKASKSELNEVSLLDKKSWVDLKPVLTQNSDMQSIESETFNTILQNEASSSLSCRSIIEKFSEENKQLWECNDKLNQALVCSPKIANECKADIYVYSIIESESELHICDESAKENISPHSSYLRGKNKEYVEIEDIKEGKEKSKFCELSHVNKQTSDLFIPSLGNNEPPVHGNSNAITTSRSYVINQRRIFIENYSNFESEEEDDSGNSVYHSCFPFEVRGCRYIQMPSVPFTVWNKSLSDAIIIDQQIFDVDQFVHEMAEKLSSEAAKRYIAVNDYDVQIIDISAETGDVIVLAMMLVQAAAKNKGQAKSRRNVSSICRKLYKTGFTFVWNIMTGKYVVIGTGDFKEESPLEISQRHLASTWNPALTISQQLQKKFFIPKSEEKFVTSMTNGSVFKGRRIIMNKERNILVYCNKK